MPSRRRLPALVSDRLGELRAAVPGPVLAAFVAVAALAWGFAKLAGEVTEGDTRSVDRALLLWFRTTGDLSDPVGPGWMEEMARDFTALGGVAVLTLLVLAVAGYLRLRGQGRSALFLLGAVAGGLAVSTVFKNLFDRARPDLVPHGSIVYSASFPSGHSMMSALTYLTLAMMLARAEPQRRVKAFLLGGALLLTILVGVSRVYLGVHWPTDVLAGWTLGAAWALFAWAVAHWLERRRMLEAEMTEAGPPPPPDPG